MAVPGLSKPRFIDFPSMELESRFRTKVTIPKRFKGELKGILARYPRDRIKLVKAGERQVVVRAKPLDIKEIIKLVSFTSQGCKYYDIWFIDSEGKKQGRSSALKINEKFYLVDYKYTRLIIEKEGLKMRTIIDKFKK